MLRDDDSPMRRAEKLERINAALIRRLERFQEHRGPAYALGRTAAVLEREVMARNRDLEETLAELAAKNSELATAREVADEANRAKSRFLRAASHDLLQPLSAARLFLSHLGELSTQPEQGALVSHLTATIESAEELIRALSNIAKLDSQTFEMNPGPLSISRLFRRLIIDMQPLATSRGIDLRFVGCSVAVESDPVFLRQIVQNLIANALKYTTGRKVLVGARRDGDAVWIEVLDMGPGILPRDQDRIFNEFERLSRTDAPGTGLGLSIVRRACIQLGHQLELHSVPGRGSCFRVRLQVVAPDALPSQSHADHATVAGRKAALSVAEGRPEMAGGDLNGHRVLVIENDPAMRKAFTLLFSAWGLHAEGVGDVSAARQAARANRPDLIITDYRLDAGETGVEALRALAADFGQVLPALIVSAESRAEIQAEAGGLSLEVLEKPVAEADLRRAVLRALNLKPGGAADQTARPTRPFDAAKSLQRPSRTAGPAAAAGRR